MIGLYRALEILSSHRTEEIVVAPFTAGVAWEDVSRRHDLDLPYWGSMGKAASTGLGLALALPDRRVWVLDGDGSLLMNLGCLVTTANMAPFNFVHLVMDNRVYATTGGQPIPGAERVDFPGLARAAGFPLVHSFEEEATLEREVGDVLRAEGPVFVRIATRPDPVPRRVPRRGTPRAVAELMESLPRLAAAAG